MFDFLERLFCPLVGRSSCSAGIGTREHFAREPHGFRSQNPRRTSRATVSLLASVWFSAALFSATASAAEPVLKILFLGDNGPHQPAARLLELRPAMKARGIAITYTEDVVTALSSETLKRYDALMLFANIDRIAPEQDQALFDYISQGGAFVPIHCASFCFRNSARFVALVGGQFRRHGAIVPFKTQIVAPDHPIMRGFSGVVTGGDEPYEHAKLNEQNRTLLETRGEEPYTWVRTEGKGRIFYTAWGHDQRTWKDPGFHDLIERGLRFAVGQPLPESLAKVPPPAPVSPAAK
jgi:uncharacterized protein